MLSIAECDPMLEIARAEARAGRDEGGIPIGAALFDSAGTLLGRGRNRRIQNGDASLHGETAAFRAVGRRRSYTDTIMVTTLSPCWYCSGLIRQFGIAQLVVGEADNFSGQHEWLAREAGVVVTVVNDDECRALMGDFITANPEIWFEDIGETR
ncbi:nucleoside deaminase [soil metagenome]